MPAAYPSRPKAATGSRRSTQGPRPRTRYGSAVEEPETTAAPRDRALVSFLVFSASRRHESLNATLARLAADTIAKHGASVDHASMSDFDVPAYDGDLERDEGLPPGAEELRRRLLASDAFVIASPEYNASMPGLLKNAVDWVSRSRPQPFHQAPRPVALRLAVDGRRQSGPLVLRVPFEHLGARIYPDMFSLAQAHTAFDADGRIADPQLHERFEALIAAFLDLVEAAEALPVHQKPMGGVSRRKTRADPRPRRVSSRGASSRLKPGERS